MFTQQTPVVFLGSDLRIPSLSSQPPPAQQVSRQASQAGECWSALILCAGISLLCPLHPFCCALLCGSDASPTPPTPHFHQWRGFLVCGNISSLPAPSHRCMSCPYSFVSVFFLFFFCPTHVCGEFLAFCEVCGLLPVFSRCSVGVVPHVGVFLMYLWRGRWSLRLTPLPSWRSSLFLNVCRTTIPFSIAAAPFSIPTNKAEGFRFLYIFTNIVFFCFSWLSQWIWSGTFLWLWFEFL